MNQSISNSHNLDDLKQQIVNVGRHLANLQFHAGLAGNISVRISRNLLLCTRHEADKGALTVRDLLLCQFDGNKVEGDGRPTSELPMHVAAYEHRPDVNAVIHAHPPTATAFAAASTPLDRLMLPEMVVLLGPVALVPYAAPGSADLCRQLAAYLPNHDGFLLENHGALTVGTTLGEAAMRMELLEHNARITLLTRQLGRTYALSQEELDTLLELRRRIAAERRRAMGQEESDTLRDSDQ